MVVIAERPASPAAPERAVADDEAAARRALRAQIARLESELARTVAAAFPHVRVDTDARRAAGPRVLSLGELEQVRDDLAQRVRRAHLAAAERARFEAANRVRLDELLRDPARHRGVRIRAADVGERGCGVYAVVPRLGVVGRLMGWWQVKLSSGCPLPERS